MKRRDFIQNTTLASGVLMISPGLLNPILVKDKRIGVQLYSVRDEVARDPRKTIEGVAKIGYKEVEGFGYNEGKFFGLTPAEFKSLLSDHGLKMPHVHHIIGLTNYEDSNRKLTDYTLKALDVYAEMGVEMTVCPYIINSQRDSQATKKLCTVFNIAGEECQKRGMTFAYHNHDFEFKSEAGQPMSMDVFLKNTDPRLVRIELDLYWVVYAGQNPVEWMQKCGNRMLAFHCKDMGPDRNTIEVGEGSIDFVSIFAAPEASHVKYYIVELEHYKRKPMEGIGVAFENLKKILNA